jgi:Sigma-70, region 4
MTEPKRPRHDEPRKVGRPKTVNVKLPLWRGEEAVSYPRGNARPLTRGDCSPSDEGGHHARPCPYVSCKYHLALDVAKNGSLKINWPAPDLDGFVANIGRMKETCALDVADRGELTLEEIGGLLNVTRERIRQLEHRLLIRLRTSESTARALGEKFMDVDGDWSDPEDFDPEFEPDPEDYLAGLFPTLRVGSPDQEPPDDLFGS